MGDAHGIAGPRGRTDARATTRHSFHDCCVELELALNSMCASDAGIEPSAVFERCYRFDYSV
jgi:hypothetical protein